MTSSLTAAPPRQQQSGRTGVGSNIALALILTCQLMVILDATIVTIALPEIRSVLHFSPTSLSWVQNAYSLAFGGLLLLGARAGDILGRRRVLMAGVTLFTAASLLGGLAQSAEWLLVARGAQGVGAAIAAPSTLALLTSSFPEGVPRLRAIGLYSAVTSGGASVGLVLGGMLTDWASWRWSLFVNVPIGIALVVLAPRYLPETRPQHGRFDLAGAITSTGGMAALVYGFVRAASDGWSDSITVSSFVAGDVRRHRTARRAADHSVANVRQPRAQQLLRRAAAAGRRHVRDVLLHDPVPAGCTRLQPAQGRIRFLADDHRAVRDGAGCAASGLSHRCQAFADRG